jgi:hypothetical protein
MRTPVELIRRILCLGVIVFNPGTCNVQVDGNDVLLEFWVTDTGTGESSLHM